VIVSFAHKGLRRFYETGSKAGIHASFADKLRLQLSRLDAASTPGQMDVPGWELHEMKGSFAGHWAVKVNANWRLTFRFEGENAEVVDLQDYH
jgi:proteic killer suppression protein